MQITHTPLQRFFIYYPQIKRIQIKYAHIVAYHTFPTDRRETRLFFPQLLDPCYYLAIIHKSRSIAVMGSCLGIVLAIVRLSIGIDQNTSTVVPVCVDDILTEQLLLRRKSVFILYSGHIVYIVAKIL